MKIIKKIFSAVAAIMKKRLFAAITLSVGAALFVVSSLMPDHHYAGDGGDARFYKPEIVTSPGQGRTAVIDNRTALYCLDGDEQLVYAVDADDFPEENVKILDAVFDGDENLYVHVMVCREDAVLTDCEYIALLDREGGIGREVVHYDYRNAENPPSRQARITGLSWYGDRLHYFYKNSDCFSLMSVDGSNTSARTEADIRADGYGEFIQTYSRGDGTYLTLRHNGEVGTITSSGAYKSLYRAKYDLKKDEGLLLLAVFSEGGSDYAVAGAKSPVLYRITDGKCERIAELNDVLDNADRQEYPSVSAGRYMGKPALVINDTVYGMENEKNFSRHSGDFSLPPMTAASVVLKNTGMPLGIIFIVLFLISAVGNLMKWRLSILSKQLFITVPLVLLTIFVIIGIMIYEMVERYDEEKANEMMAISEMAAGQFDSGELSGITGYESVDDGKVIGLERKLRGLLEGNQAFWSRKYTGSVFLKKDELHYVLAARSDEVRGFLVGSITAAQPLEENFYKESRTVISSLSEDEDGEVMEIWAETPVYNTDGSFDAIVVISAYEESYVGDIIAMCEKMLLIVFLCTVVLIILLTVASAWNTRSLKSAGEVVSRIAGGDFHVRVEKFPRDEVGEICAGVNDMAGRLLQYFQEKDRNERFYYKFVPEKFRELLHKEHFTDLSLGDAESMDLTVLFCDIRAFSMNSEMMTAKESFDFVNRIYGKAGPIIRENNGFVDKYIGDAVMALFESADAAVNAGIALYREIVLNPGMAEELGVSSLNIGVGIHSGTARIGIVGEEERMSGTVISDTVNLSSRLESLTKQYGTAMIISKDTMNRMSDPDALSVRYLGMVQVAGVNEIISLYEVLDCLDDEKRERRMGSRFEFREAVRLYHMGELKRAEEIFGHLSEADETDVAARIYRDYIDAKLEQGQTEHNVFRFDKK